MPLNSHVSETVRGWQGVLGPPVQLLLRKVKRAEEISLATELVLSYTFASSSCIS